ncbi:MAG: alpha/beta fold hydrolase, partial [Actinomycetes bacterium]
MSTPPFLDLPAGVSAAPVPSARGELAALLADPADVIAGAPVLLLPGFTGSKEDFIGVLAPIAAAGHRVVAVDQRGQFESPGEDDPTSYDVKALAEDVLAVARHLGRPIH